MLTPRTSIAAMALVAAIICPSFANALTGVAAYAQQTQAAVVNPERERGAELFRQGKVDEAIKALREATKKSKTDAEAWNFLGSALIRKKDAKNARKAFETAVKLRPDYAAAHYNLAYALLLTNKTSEAAKEAHRAIALDASIAEAHYVLGMIYLRENSGERAVAEADATIKLNASFAPAHLLRSRALTNLYGTWAIQASRASLRASPQTEEATRATRLEESKKRRILLRQAADSLEQYLKLAPAEAASETWREQLETLRIHGGRAETKTDSERVAFNTTEVGTKARILSRPEPQYTDEARGKNIAGTVVLSAIFAADGAVKHILVISSLPHGLTEAAMRAARGIRFAPATKDGRPVSQFIQIEYNFNLY